MDGVNCTNKVSKKYLLICLITETHMVGVGVGQWANATFLCVFCLSLARKTLYLKLTN